MESLHVETKSEFAYRHVRGEILAGSLEPGAVIQQRDLAARLGISTTPLREAMRRLEADGLVELDNHRDARVAPLRMDEARDLLELRQALDPLAAAMAAERRTEQDVDDITATLAALQPLPARPSLEQLVRHRDFHRAIYRASHNDLLVESLERLWDKQDRYRQHALRQDPESATLELKAEEHRLLAEHVIAGEADSAREVMHLHIAGSHGARALRELSSPEGPALDGGQAPR